MNASDETAGQALRGVPVLLTGGTGFVGSHLAERLSALGADLRCLVRSPERAKDLEKLGARLFFGDLHDDDALSRAVEGCRYIFHLAGATKALRRDDLFKVNEGGTERLVQAASGDGQLKRFIHVSSLAACGPSATGKPLDEKDAPQPVSNYGKSKLAGERVLQASDLPWVIVRPPAVYGPRDRDMLLFFKLARFKLSIRLGWLARTVSLVFVEDLVQGLCACIKSPEKEVFFISDPAPYAWDQVVQSIGATLNKSLWRFTVPFCLLPPAAWASDWLARFKGRPDIFSRDKVRELACAHWVCSPEKAASLLDFSTRHDLAAGFARTIKWYRHAGWL